MLDITAYRASETLAKTCIPGWRIAQTHNVDHFERVGFPVRLTTLQETAQLLDTMQENRFAAYMQEMGGWTADELYLFVEACRDVIDFQLASYPHRRPILPLSTMISAFAAFKKITAYNPDFSSVLEVGPGCGYVSFFLKRHGALRDYSQIEACESFYILQSMVNNFCFGPRFIDHALPPNESIACDWYVARTSEDLEFSPTFDERPVPAVCNHYPWWRIGELVKLDKKFDIIMSNANLLEFRADALADYLSLYHVVLKEDGILLVQCTGFTAHGTLDGLLTQLHKQGFATAAFFESPNVVSFPVKKGKGLVERVTTRHPEPRKFATNNGVYIKKGHPQFKKYHSESEPAKHFIGDDSFIRDMFFASREGRRNYSFEEIVSKVKSCYPIKLDATTRSKPEGAPIPTPDTAAGRG